MTGLEDAPEHRLPAGPVTLQHSSLARWWQQLADGLGHSHPGGRERDTRSLEVAQVARRGTRTSNLIRQRGTSSLSLCIRLKQWSGNLRPHDQ